MTTRARLVPLARSGPGGTTGRANAYGNAITKFQNYPTQRAVRWPYTKQCLYCNRWRPDGGWSQKCWVYPEFSLTALAYNFGRPFRPIDIAGVDANRRGNAGDAPPCSARYRARLGKHGPVCCRQSSCLCAAATIRRPPRRRAARGGSIAAPQPRHRRGKP